MAIICDNCGRENEDEFRFCLGCGSALTKPEPEEPKEEPEMIDCPHCGTEVPAGFKFCGACGGSLEGPTAPKPAAKAAPSSPEAASTVRGGPGSGAAAAAMTGGEALGELTVIRPDGSEGARIPLSTSGLIIGRKSEFEVLAKDDFLSPRHAEIRYEAGVLKLRDLNSLNGVYWRLRDDVELHHGDLIRVGQEVLSFELMDKVPALADEAPAEGTRLQGSPNPGAWARLALIGGPDVETRAFAISGDEATIGREIGTILFREDGFVSGKHARVYRDGDKYFLRDLGSSNGSYLKIRKERRLSDGDLVLMGQQLLRVTLN